MKNKRLDFVVLGLLLALLVVGISYVQGKSQKEREHLEEIISELEQNKAEVEQLYEATIQPDPEPVKEEPKQVEPVEEVKQTVRGKASYYYPGDADGSGTRTANGDHFTGEEMTAAHMTLPFGTRVRVTNPKSGQSVVVKINDRGGFDKLGRVIDLSKAAFQAIAPLSSGVVNVELEVLS